MKYLLTLLLFSFSFFGFLFGFLYFYEVLNCASSCFVGVLAFLQLAVYGLRHNLITLKDINKFSLMTFPQNKHKTQSFLDQILGTYGGKCGFVVVLL